MASLDNSLIGSVINALPIERMIAGPLQAMVDAQAAASRSYHDFLLQVCIENGKAVAVEFDYDEAIVDEQGVGQSTVTRRIRMPLMAIITHPNISIEEGQIDFEMTVSQQAEDMTETGATAAVSGKVGWGCFSLKLKGEVSHKSAQTRKSDTRARYSFSTKIARQPPPEALMRVIDVLTNASIKPITSTDGTPAKETLLAGNR